MTSERVARPKPLGSPPRIVVMTIDPAFSESTSEQLDQAGPLAWVTGASSGIGRALAQRLAREGWRVAVSARSADRLDELAREQPGRIFAFPLDITDQDAVGRTVAAICNRLGAIDMAVLNAGTYEPIWANNLDFAGFAKTFSVDLVGTVACLCAVAPAMISAGRGHIAVTGSMTGYFGLPSAAAYGASKAALNNLCEALRPDLARYGVALTIINPGFVKTPLTDLNTFSMPFLVPLDEATDRIVEGLKSRKFEIAFPWRLGLALRLLRLLPRSLQFAITRRMLR
jgi:NAD(P)-dependent dehydrogenase (short-subunit alcohol dehydrogenase family)